MRLKLGRLEGVSGAPDGRIPPDDSSLFEA